MYRYILPVLLCLLCGSALPGQSSAAQHPPLPGPKNVARPAEYPVRLLPLSGEITDPRAEISSLAWYGDTLLLMPQYPDWADEEPRLYALDKTEILDRIRQKPGSYIAPLEPRKVPVLGPNPRDMVRLYQGLEALCVHGDRAYLSIEAGGRISGMSGFLVAGTLKREQQGPVLVLDNRPPLSLPLPADLRNMTFEALTWSRGRLLAIFEANGRNVNMRPFALSFSPGLEPLGEIPFPAVEYRITDAAMADDKGVFKAVNLHWHGDKHINPARDPIAVKYGRGQSHAQTKDVARILTFRDTGLAIELVDSPPIQTQLSFVPHNWEGLVVLNEPDLKGLLLATDKFPGTQLGFVGFASP